MIAPFTTFVIIVVCECPTPVMTFDDVIVIQGFLSEKVTLFSNTYFPLKLGVPQKCHIPRNNYVNFG